MWIPFFSGRHSRADHRPTRRAPVRTRLTVEALEGRAVPAVFTAATAADLIADITISNQTAESDTINLTPGARFTLTTVNNTTDGPTAMPVIAANNKLTIVGNGDVIENAGIFARLFDVAPKASLTLTNLSLLGGRLFSTGWTTTQGGGFQPTGAQGGGILNQGTLTITDVIIRDCVAEGPSGAQFLARLPPAPGLGGAVYSTGTLSAVNCTFQDDAALGGTGLDEGVSQDPGFPATVVPAQQGANAFGGAVYIAGGNATFVHCTFSGNEVHAGAGGHGAKRDAKSGKEDGGDIYIAAGVVKLDAFTKNHLSHSQQPGKTNDIYGSYTLG